MRALYATAKNALGISSSRVPGAAVKHVTGIQGAVGAKNVAAIPSLAIPSLAIPSPVAVC